MTLRCRKTVKKTRKKDEKRKEGDDVDGKMKRKS
jgi:hypothetical protein